MDSRENFTFEDFDVLKAVSYRCVVVDHLKISFQGIRYDARFGTSTPPHTHDFYEFHYILKGKLKTKVHNLERTYSSGQCYVMTPAAIHSHESFDPPDNNCLSFAMRWELQRINGNAFNPELDGIRTAFERSHAEIIDDSDGTIAAEMAAIIALARNGASRIELLLRLAGMVVTIGSRYASMKSSSPPVSSMRKAAESILQQAISFVENHSSEALTPSDVAAGISVSYSHLARLFSQYMNMPINQYITSVKIDKALHLILSTNMSLKDIAQATGFLSASHFSNTFRRIVGFSPRNFQKFIKEQSIRGDYTVL